MEPVGNSPKPVDECKKIKIKNILFVFIITLAVIAIILLFLLIFSKKS